MTGRSKELFSFDSDSSSLNTEELYQKWEYNYNEPKSNKNIKLPHFNKQQILYLTKLWFNKNVPIELNNIIYLIFKIIEINTNLNFFIFLIKSV